MDLPLLLKEHERNPADTRTVFYLGQTYDLIGDVDNALATYQQRIVMGGWQQEVFESHLRRVSHLEGSSARHKRLVASARGTQQSCWWNACGSGGRCAGRRQRHRPAHANICAKSFQMPLCNYCLDPLSQRAPCLARSPCA